MNRRDFIFLGATLVAGCAGPDGGRIISGPSVKTVNAGPAAQYLPDGVYARYRDAGFFIVRRGGMLSAISAVCTHRRCKLEAATDQTFYCPCHGSTFDGKGKVTHGPARQDLPAYETSINEKGELLVRIFGLQT